LNSLSFSQCGGAFFFLSLSWWFVFLRFSFSQRDLCILVGRFNGHDFFASVRNNVTMAFAPVVRHRYDDKGIGDPAKPPPQVTRSGVSASLRQLWRAFAR
jgi:hypothetical protein